MGVEVCEFVQAADVSTGTGSLKSIARACLHLQTAAQESKLDWSKLELQIMTSGIVVAVQTAIGGFYARFLVRVLKVDLSCYFDSN